jgi:AraC family transcriptional regulator
MPDGPLCTTPYKGTSGLSLYKSAGQLLRHLRSRQFPIGMTLSHMQSEGALVMDEWMHRVISLLEAAVGQLHDQVHPAQGTLLEAASLLRRQIDPPAAKEVPDGRGRLLAWQARKVRDYIDSHITGPVLVADLCALVQRSEAHFSRAFRGTFGYSPHAFVIRRRVELAAKYMLKTDLSLSDIALGCGFVDQAHLCKHFRAVTGETPAAWRRAKRAQGPGGP